METINNLIQGAYHGQYMPDRWRVLAVDLLTYLQNLKHLTTGASLVKMEKINVFYYFYDALQISHRLKDNWILFVTIGASKTQYATIGIHNPVTGQRMVKLPYMEDIQDVNDLKISLLELFHWCAGRGVLS